MTNQAREESLSFMIMVTDVKKIQADSTALKAECIALVTKTSKAKPNSLRNLTDAPTWWVSTAKKGALCSTLTH